MNHPGPCCMTPFPCFPLLSNQGLNPEEWPSSHSSLLSLELHVCLSPALSIADNTGKWHGSFFALVTFLCHLLATAWVVIPVSDSRLSTQAVRLPQSTCAHCCRRICFSVVGSFADSTFSQETVSLFSMAVSVFFKSPPPCVLEHQMSVAYVKE